MYAQLEAGRAGEVRVPKQLPLAGSGSVCWKQMKTTRHNTSSTPSPAAASASAGAASSGTAPDADVVQVFEYRGRDYIRADQAEAAMSPKPKGTAEYNTIRPEVCTASPTIRHAVQGWCFVRAKVPSMKEGASRNKHNVRIRLNLSSGTQITTGSMRCVICVTQVRNRSQHFRGRRRSQAGTKPQSGACRRHMSRNVPTSGSRRITGSAGMPNRGRGAHRGR
ncbi:hypothetical protein N9L68_00760 [bacterium]|nr:hypothetical protein [bacterium]